MNVNVKAVSTVHLNQHDQLVAQHFWVEGLEFYSLAKLCHATQVETVVFPADRLDDAIELLRIAKRQRG